MSNAIGVDFGTAFFQTAEKNGSNLELQDIRNVFVEIEDDGDVEDVLKQNEWQYIKDKNKFYIIGEDAQRVAKIFPKVELRRPMKDGVLNKGEDKKMIVLSKMLEDSIGKASDKFSVVCFCVSSETIDANLDNTFHKARLEGMVKRLGYKPKCIDEGLAVILAERPVLIESDGSESPYSGIGISFGGGKVNCVLAYKGLPIIGFSCKRGGDYIDKMVSEQTDTPLVQVISKKESNLDFNNINFDDDTIFALDAYYSNMIEYVFKNFAKKFQEVKSEFDSPLEIVLAGGTSMPKGFRDKVKEVVMDLDLPFEIKDIKQSDDPRNSVVKGLLTQAIITQKKMKKEDKPVKEEEF